jgi:heat shock protein HspQ
LNHLQQLPFLIDLWDDESTTVHEGVLKGLGQCGRSLYEWIPTLNPQLGETLVRQILLELGEYCEKDKRGWGLNLYKPGQIVEHRRYGYRGVLVDVDYYCMATNEWYSSNTTQPPKCQPWYHVLVDNSDAVTYAAESSLGTDDIKEPVEHPYLQHFFERFRQGAYVRNDRPWPRDEDVM